jgi:hypothetical protein
VAFGLPARKSWIDRMADDYLLLSFLLGVSESNNLVSALRLHHQKLL